ncbi:MAG: PadR family transcriptional regulator [Terriglobales bacterium]
MKRKKDSLQDALPLLVLKILARRGALHGYGITTVIQSMSEERLRPEEGSLYPALHRLEEQGWVAAEWQTTENNRRARVYSITVKGRKELAAVEARWRTASAAILQVLQRA